MHDDPSYPEKSTLARHWITLVVMLSIAVTTIVIYSNSTHGPFIFDDKSAISHRTDIRVEGISYDAVMELFAGRASRPVANFTFALNYLFGGYHTTGYHIVNMIIHMLNGMLLFFFIRTTLRRVTGPEKETLPTAAHIPLLAAFTALIWVANPLHTNSVTYIVQRMNSLAALFYLASLLFYIKGRTLPDSEPSTQNRIAWKFSRLLYFFAAFACAVLAAGSKENALMLPVCILLYEWIFISPRTFTLSENKVKAVVITSVALLLMIAGYFALSAYYGVTLSQTLAGLYALQDFTLNERLLSEFRVVLFYISLILFPHPQRLNLDYNYPVSISLANPAVTLVCMAAVFILLASAFFSRQRDRLIAFAVFWFFINLVIESSFIPLALIYEHRTYIPSMMVCFLPLLLMFRHIRSQWLTAGICTVILLIFSLWTFQRNVLWQDDVTFWQDSVTKSPGQVRPLSNLGIATAAAGEIDKAIQLYHQSLRLNPTAEIYNNLGSALFKKGNPEKAIFYYLQALALKPDYTNAHMNLGNTYSEIGNLEKALYHYREYEKKFPHSITLHNNIGKALIHAGKPDEAENYIQKVLSMDPRNSSACTSIGAIMTYRGDYETAAAWYKKALSFEPNSELARKNLNQVREYLHNTEAVARNLQQQIAQSPENPNPWFLLGQFYFKKGRYDAAALQFQQAISLSSDFTEALYQLAVTYALQGKLDAAIDEFKKLYAQNPEDSIYAYNIACLYSRKNDQKSAMNWLKKAVELGYDNLDQLQSDMDLHNIREHPDFLVILQKLKK